MQLDRDTREVLLGVALSEEERTWGRLGRILGTTLDLETLLSLEKKTKGSTATPLPAEMHVPLLAALAPDVFAHFAKQVQTRYRALAEKYAEVPTGGSLVDIGTLSPTAAKELFRRMQLASGVTSGDTP